MQFNSTDLGAHTLRVQLNGRLDTPGVDQIEAGFAATVRAAGKHLLIDLSAVSFVSSMGVRMLISAAKLLLGQQRRMVLFGAQPLVQEMLDTVALDQIVPIARSEVEALGLLGG